MMVDGPADTVEGRLGRDSRQIPIEGKAPAGPNRVVRELYVWVHQPDFEFGLIGFFYSGVVILARAASR